MSVSAVVNTVGIAENGRVRIHGPQCSLCMGTNEGEELASTRRMPPAFAAGQILYTGELAY